jgi:DNA mismatch repair ATPase MutS
MQALRHLKNIDVKKLILEKENYEHLMVFEEEEKHAQEQDGSLQHVALKHIIKHIEMESDVLLGKDVISDIELVKSYDGSENTILNKINRTELAGSKHFLEKVLCTPIFDKTILQNRKLLLTRIESLIESNAWINPMLLEMVPLEKDITWLYSCTDEDISSLYDMVYFRYWFVKHMNHNEAALTCHNLYRILVSPVIGIVSPITYFVVPYLVLRFKFKLPIGFFSYIRMTFMSLFSKNGLMNQLSPGVSKFKYVSYAFSLLFYFQSLFNSVEISRGSLRLSKMITSKVNNIVSFIQKGKKVHDTVWGTDVSCMFPMCIPFDDGLNCFENTNLAPFKLVSNFGKQLKIFKTMKKDSYLPLINRVYMIDCIFSIIKAKKEFVFCYPDYEDNGPRLTIKGVWHPCLDVDRVVKNDVVLGTDEDTKIRNILLTGPNAGGKSTLIKSVVISVVLAQTVGITNATVMRISPFKFINSQIHIPDCKGKESLFEAEMYRSKSNFDNIKEIDGNPSFIVMDEIFSSTNPVEGIAGAYAVAKSLASHETNLSIISTHYIYLTKLAKETKLFVNYKMNVDICDGLITYPYRMSKGVSKQYIALDLLKKNGFDPKIIEEGMRVKEKLLKPVIV